jgi:hypothetical protein
VETDLRCASQARALGADPGGTAVASNAFLVVEVPLPWPHDIADHASVVAAAQEIKTIGARVQGVVPPRDDAQQAQAVLSEHEGGPFRAYTRRDACLDATDLASGIRSLAESPVAQDGTRDLLVCTHGARDRCCGSMGTSLAMDVSPREGLRVRRTSHLGGHRFAPTAVLFPEGTAWAWLDDGLLDAILDRSGDVGRVLPHYRGSTAMATPAEQFTEHAVYGEVGWDWLDTERAGSVIATDGDWTTVRIESSLGAWVGVVQKLGTVPQPVCGEELSAAKKADDVLKLVDFSFD